MKKLIPVLLLTIGCTEELTSPEIGDPTRCPPKAVSYKLNYTLPNDPKVYALELAICAYEVTGVTPRPEIPTEFITITVTRESLERAARR